MMEGVRGWWQLNYPGWIDEQKEQNICQIMIISKIFIKIQQDFKLQNGGGSAWSNTYWTCAHRGYFCLYLYFPKDMLWYSPWRLSNPDPRSSKK